MKSKPESKTLELAQGQPVRGGKPTHTCCSRLFVVSESSERFTITGLVIQLVTDRAKQEK